MIKYVTYSRIFSLRVDAIKECFDKYFSKGHNCFAILKPFLKANSGMGLCVGCWGGSYSDYKVSWLVEMWLWGDSACGLRMVLCA